MAPWGDIKLFFCILFITCWCTGTLAEMPMDCCLRVKNKMVDKHIVADYRQQVSGQGCSIDAMVLMGKGGRTLCVPANEPWVKKVVNYVNHLRKVCKTNKKMKPCVGVKLE
ncbi:C-C motif chemokine 19-like [Trachinotus anak]|uniref:C-C motif chemokine 19-like n=1 Tax=Trachinotus anak TaxID=443729 RepID=UPI0039F231CF